MLSDEGSGLDGEHPRFPNKVGILILHLFLTSTLLGFYHFVSSAGLCRRLSNNVFRVLTSHPLLPGCASPIILLLWQYVGTFSPGRLIFRGFPLESFECKSEYNRFLLTFTHKAILPVF